jgi:hypothetical protein
MSGAKRHAPDSGSEFGYNPCGGTLYEILALCAATLYVRDCSVTSSSGSIGVIVELGYFVEHVRCACGGVFSCVSCRRMQCHR